MNKLIKEYDKTSTSEFCSPSSQKDDLSIEIKQLEEENLQLKEQIKLNIESNITFPVSNSFENNISSPSILKIPATTTETQHPASSLFDNFSPQPQNSFPIEDPFQEFDPFNNNDPFKGAPIDAAKTISGDDPFAEAFDPFNQHQDVSANSAFGSDDPFNVIFLTFKLRTFSKQFLFSE